MSSWYDTTARLWQVCQAQRIAPERVLAIARQRLGQARAYFAWVAAADDGPLLFDNPDAQPKESREPQPPRTSAYLASILQEAGLNPAVFWAARAHLLDRIEVEIESGRVSTPAFYTYALPLIAALFDELHEFGHYVSASSQQPGRRARNGYACRYYPADPLPLGGGTAWRNSGIPDSDAWLRRAEPQLYNLLKLERYLA